MVGIKSLSLGVLALLPAMLAAPSFTKLFDGTLFIDTTSTSRTTVGPFGTRTLIRFSGGNLTDPGSGDVVATIFGDIGGELGLLGSNNVFYPDVRLGFQWVDDKKYAFAELHGSGEFGISAMTYIRFETDSKSHSNLNGLFALFAIDFTGGYSPSPLAIYGLNN